MRSSLFFPLDFYPFNSLYFGKIYAVHKITRRISTNASKKVKNKENSSFIY